MKVKILKHIFFAAFFASVNLCPAMLSAVQTEKYSSCCEEIVWESPYETSCWWGSVNYLLLWMKSADAPPLAISGPLDHPPKDVAYSRQHVPTSPGFIGLYNIREYAINLNRFNATHTLFGNSMNASPNSGAQITIGKSIGCGGCAGLEASYLFLGERSDSFKGSPSSHPSLGIPYFDTFNNGSKAYLINRPAIRLFSEELINTTPAVYVNLFTTETLLADAGYLSIRFTSGLQAADLNTTWSYPLENCGSFDLIAGFKYVLLKEDLKIWSKVTHRSLQTTTMDPALGLPTGEIPIINNVIADETRSDLFSSSNQFFGVQFGGRSEVEFCKWKVAGSSLIALGTMLERIHRKGKSSYTQVTTQTPTTDIRLAGIPLVVAAEDSYAVVTNTITGASKTGLFVQKHNRKPQSRNVFAAVFQGQLQLLYEYTCNLQFGFGYQVLYLSSVVRPGDAIDHKIDSRQLADPPVTKKRSRPYPRCSHTDYWAQGLTLNFTSLF